MGRNEAPEPAEVVDRLLWRDAQQILNRHTGPDAADRCQWCGGQWPCPPRELAERADEASRRPWRDPRSAVLTGPAAGERTDEPPGGVDLEPGGSQRTGWRLAPGQRVDPGQRNAGGQRLPTGQRLQPGRRPRRPGQVPRPTNHGLFE